MNYVLILVQKKNKIHLIYEIQQLNLRYLKIFKYDTIESIINDVKFYNLNIFNLKF